MTNSDHKVNPYSPSAEYRYFLYDPDYGHTFYRTPEERDAAAESLIKGYLSDGEWIKDVVDVFAGEATHQVNEVERLDRVGTLDEDGYDENVEFFENADVDYKCDYQLQRLSLLTLAAPVPAEPTEMVVPPAEGEVGELVAALKGDAACIEAGQHDLCSNTADQLTRAADLLQQQAAELATLRRQAEPPVEGEAWSVAQSLRRRLAQKPMGCADPTLIRAAELLERLAGELATLRSAPHA